jgi:hypothetical protein
MYLGVSNTLGQPRKEPSREELEQELLLCRRDGMMAARSSTQCDQALAYTERVLQDAMSDLAKCRTPLEAARAALKAARKRAEAARKRRATK